MAMLAPILVLVLMAQGAKASGQVLEIMADGKKTSFDVAHLGKRLPLQSLAIKAPVYGTTKKFDGFWLNDVLKLAGVESTARADEIVFTALDGYSPSTSFDTLRKYRGFLAIGESGHKGFPEKVRQGKASVSPGPIFLIWSEAPSDDHTTPWPYQLAKIEIVSFEKKFNHVYPNGIEKDDPAYFGFLLFRRECLRCHSINLQGGDVGPELNAPKSITEYWEISTLKKFIMDPSKFRYRSKMPAFSNLSETQVDQILSYLSKMRSQKITKVD